MSILKRRLIPIIFQIADELCKVSFEDHESTVILNASTVNYELQRVGSGIGLTIAQHDDRLHSSFQQKSSKEASFSDSRNSVKNSRKSASDNSDTDTRQKSKSSYTGSMKTHSDLSQNGSICSSSDKIDDSLLLQYILQTKYESSSCTAGNQDRLTDRNLSNNIETPLKNTKSNDKKCTMTPVAEHGDPNISKKNNKNESINLCNPVANMWIPSYIWNQQNRPELSSLPISYQWLVKLAANICCTTTRDVLTEVLALEKAFAKSHVLPFNNR